MKERHADISLCITDILIDGKSLEKMEEKQRREISPLTADFTDKLVIPAAYTHFTICFASLTYHQPQLNNYAYRLQGFGTMQMLITVVLITLNYRRESIYFKCGLPMRTVIGERCGIWKFV